MKVSGPGPAAFASGSRAARATGGGFSISSGPQQAAAAPAMSSASGLAGVSALMALQGVEDPTERRRRAIHRGSGLLDRLDDLKLALLSGGDGRTALGGLSRAAAEARAGDLDAGLSAVLDQIDLRAAVELAKAERRAA